MRDFLPGFRAFILCLLPLISQSQVTQEWARKFVGLGNDNAAAITADNSGNVYIVGNTNWGFNTADIYLVRYNSSGLQTGGILYNSPYNNADEAVAVVTDASGNVYVAGRVSVNIGTTDIVVMKFNSSMTQQWVTIFNTPENYIDDVNAMKVDAAGNVYLTGSIVKGPFEYDYLTIKLNSSGNVVWHATYNGTANGVDIANDIVVDALGNVFVTGLSAGLIRRVFFNVATGYDVLTVKYSADGAQQWVQRYNLANRNDEGNSIALDAAGNVFVSGFANSFVNNDCVTLKYSNDGIQQWAQLYNGTLNQNDEAKKILVDGSGNAIICGHTNIGASSGSDILAIKYNSSGVAQWVGTYTAGNNTADLGNAMGIDQFGDAYVSGSTSVPGLVSSDYITIKFNSTGSIAWAVRYNGSENQSDAATSIVVVNSRNIASLANATVYVYGTSNSDVVTVKYTQPTIIEPPIFVEARQNTAQENADNAFRIYHYPNPANAYTHIYYQLPQDGKLIVTLHDALGRKLSTLVEGSFKTGTYNRRLGATTLPGGEYYYHVIFQGGGKTMVQTNKIIVQK